MTVTLLISILLKVTVTTALALAASRFARRSSAAVRHVLLAAAFAVLLILPIASMLAPSVRVAMPVVVQQAIEPLDAPPIIEAVPSTGAADAVTPETSAAESWTWPSLSRLLLGAWMAGTAAFLLPVVLGLWQVRSLRQTGVPWGGGRALVATLAADAGIHRSVDVVLHESLPGPMTCGLVHPAIVLPADAQTWQEQNLRRAIVHELEHVRRRDWISQCVARVIAACYWFHPIVWMAWRQLSLEAERACDDAVLLSTSVRATSAAPLNEEPDSSTEYADQLVVLAERLSTVAHQPQLAMASRRDLATRVVAVLDSRQRRGRASAWSIGLAALASALLVTTISPLRIVSAHTADEASASISGQVTADRTTGAPQRFEAASIKPCAPEEQLPGRGRGGAGGTNATASPGRFNVPCVTLEQLIYLAYASYGAREDEHLANDYFGAGSDETKVRGGPAWVHSYKDKYAIEATAPGMSDRFTLMGTMLRTLLEERFHLRTHRESEDLPMYALRVAKGGLKLKPMKEGDCDPDAGGTPPPWTGTPCGFMTNGRVGPNTRWHYVGFKLSFLARQLSAPLGMHVIDETGVADDFMIDLEFATDDAISRAEPPGAEQAPPAPSIFTALEQQLGLKLEKIRGPHGYLVIDHVERPTLDSAIQTSPPKFSVASVKPCDAMPVVPGGRSGGGGSLVTTPGTIHATCMSVVEMVRRAYVQYGDPPPLNNQALFDEGLITGGPAWARTDRFTIEAKAEGTPAPALMTGAMLRSLLEGRFQLKIHQDVKEVPVFALTVASGGLKLKPVDPASCAAPDPNAPGAPRTLGADGLVRAAEGEKPLCVGGVGRAGANLTYTVTGQTFDRVSKTLSSLLLTRPVIDRTGLNDQFSFRVEFAPDETMRPMPAPRAETAGTPDGPSLFSVFEKQLGLKIVPAKAQQGSLVIDRVERPSGN